MPFYYCSLPNDKASRLRMAECITDDAVIRDAFVRKYDVPGRAVYWCPNPLKEGATTRSLETIAEIHCLAFDLDFKALAADPEEVDARLLQLPLEPSAVINSGFGRHGYLYLKEPIPADDEDMFERARDVQKRLAAALSADPAPAHPAALMRWPGSHNSKRDGEPVLVEALWGSAKPVDLTDVEAMLDMLPEDGIFERKANGHDPGSPLVREGPVDVDESLEAMTHGNIHSVELSVTASLLRQGLSVEATVLTVLEEMQRHAVDATVPGKWDWAKEQHDLYRMCYDFVGKHPELSPALHDELREKFEAKHDAGKAPRIYWAPTYGWHVRAGRGMGDTWQRDHPGAAQAEARVESEAPAPRPPRFKLVAFSDLKIGVEPLYLVDELIPVAGLVDVWGKAKCFKSFWCFDLMLHVAMGWEYRDRYVQQGAVVYCAFEGGHGYKKRKEAVRRHYNLAEDADVPLYVMSGSANLIAEHRVLISDIETALGELKPAAVVLDTLNKSLFGSENKDTDMGAYVRAAEAIRDRFRCVVIIIHHCGYDDTRPRGHSSLPGAVDAQLAVMRAENVITVTVEMMRDGPEDTQVVSAVEVIEVGQDQNGKTLTSLIVVPSDATAVGLSSRWPRGLRVFHAALRAALATGGTDFQPEPGALPVRAVGQAAVRERFYATYAEAEENPKKRQAKMQKAFVRALGDAQHQGLIATRHLSNGQTLVWIVEGIL